MKNNKSELEILKQLFSTLSDDGKKSFLKSIKSKEQIAKKLHFIKDIKECPHCKSTHFVKNGKTQGKQRFMCMDCHKTFTNTNNTILFKTQKDFEIWKKYIHCIIKKYSLRKSAKICGIALSTAFYWRHKILDALQNMQDEVKLNGVIEADETFTAISFKGNYKDFKLPRLAKKREMPAVSRGLSKEQVCITCGINLNGLSTVKVSNLAKPRLQDI